VYLAKTFSYFAGSFLYFLHFRERRKLNIYWGKEKSLLQTQLLSKSQANWQKKKKILKIAQNVLVLGFFIIQTQMFLSFWFIPNTFFWNYELP
jgi:hypothetical protein